MKEENQAIIKALNMYGRVPEQWELLNEIERLKEKVKEWQDISTRINEDNNRLNNIIDKAIEIYEQCCKTNDFSTCDLEMYEVLKGSDKE